jgi:signal transduction histidine kinase
VKISLACHDLIISPSKHSNANRARLSISRNNRVVEIRVEDNGQGFNPERLESSAAGQRTFGLMGLKERTRMLDGTIDVYSTPGAGTTIVVKLPFHEQTHA